MCGRDALGAGDVRVHETAGAWVTVMLLMGSPGWVTG